MSNVHALAQNNDPREMTIVGPSGGGRLRSTLEVVEGLDWDIEGRLTLPATRVGVTTPAGYSQRAECGDTAKGQA